MPTHQRGAASRADTSKLGRAEEEGDIPTQLLELSRLARSDVALEPKRAGKFAAAWLELARKHDAKSVGAAEEALRVARRALAQREPLVVRAQMRQPSRVCIDLTGGDDERPRAIARAAPRGKRPWSGAHDAPTERPAQARRPAHAEISLRGAGAPRPAAATARAPHSAAAACSAADYDSWREPLQPAPISSELLPPAHPTRALAALAPTLAATPSPGGRDAQLADEEEAKAVQSDHTCLICKGVLFKPATLPCMHSYCIDCAREWRDNLGPRDAAPCPACKTMYGTLALNERLSRNVANLYPIATASKAMERERNSKLLARKRLRTLMQGRRLELSDARSYFALLDAQLFNLDDDAFLCKCGCPCVRIPDEVRARARAHEPAFCSAAHR